MKDGRLNGFICSSRSSTAVLRSTVPSRRPNRTLVDRGSIEARYLLLDARRQAAKREKALQLVPFIERENAPPRDKTLQLVHLPVLPERRLQLVHLPSAPPSEKRMKVVNEDGKMSPGQDFQIVDMRVSIHCQGCAGKVKKLLTRMEGVTSVRIDLDEKRVTVEGRVSAEAVLQRVSKVKRAELWS